MKKDNEHEIDVEIISSEDNNTVNEEKAVVEDEITQEYLKRVNELENRILELEKKNNELDDKYLKKVAEFDNFRKRQQKLFQDMNENFRDDIITRFLDVMDNFERALDSCPIDDSSHSAYIEGFQMIAQQMLDFLRGEDVQPIEETDIKFDPNRHEAIQQVETDEHEPGTIVNVHQKGYCRGERLIRPAKVAVACKPKS